MPTVVFPGRYDSLEQIATLIQQAALDFGLDSCAAYGVETAVDEACSNIIEHAYGGENKGSIEVSYEIAGRELIITLRDSGRKFNPKKVAPPNLTAPLKNRQAHGLGLFFMRQWMDEIRFERVAGHNVLTMIKRKGHSP